MRQELKSSLLIVVLLISPSLLAQQQPKKQKPALKSFPVSKYMRKIGVLYLTTIDDFSKHCDGLMSDANVQRECSAATENWTQTFTEIEDPVNIELSDSKATGDLRTWTLLQNVKIATHMYLLGFMLNGEPGKEAMERWVKPMSTCRTYAEFAVFGAIRGEVSETTYDGDGGCGDLVLKAVKYKPPPPPPLSEELRAKCTPFADGSVEKVLAKMMPLPPKECREALGWMRDARLAPLYGTDNSAKQ